MKNEGSGNVLVVSHGLSISALLDTLFDDFKMPEGGLKNASVSVIKVKDGKYNLESVNDTSYIEAGKNRLIKRLWRKGRFLRQSLFKIVK